MTSSIPPISLEPWRAYFLQRHADVAGQVRRLHPDTFSYAGWETRTAADRYHWDGLKRGVDAAHPQVVFQVTLDGYGIYENNNGTRDTIPPGSAFAAVVPSDHRYYLPPESEAWTFFWIILRHPYVVERMIAQQSAAGLTATVFPVTADSVLVARAVALWEGVFPDRFAEELALFEFLIEYERHIAALASDGEEQAAAETLREDARRAVLADLARPLDVAEIARTHGMSRSRYSHHFKAATGASPARFLLGVRLEEVARRLVHTDLTLAQIADETGFADANHLCKAFRRHYHLTPGVFRRQMR